MNWIEQDLDIYCAYIRDGHYCIYGPSQTQNTYQLGFVNQYNNLIILEPAASLEEAKELCMKHFCKCIYEGQNGMD